MKRFFSILIAAMALAIPLVACGSADNTGTLASGNTQSSISTSGSTPTKSTGGSTPTIAAPKKHFKVGDSVEVGGRWKIVVNGVTTNPGKDYSTPTKGVFLIVEVTMTNISTEEQSVSSYNFGLKDSSGIRYTNTYASALGVPDEPSGKVEANGGLVKGCIIYDVPTSAKSFAFTFESNFFSSGQTIWDISI